MLYYFIMSEFSDQNVAGTISKGYGGVGEEVIMMMVMEVGDGIVISVTILRIFTEFEDQFVLLW